MCVHQYSVVLSGKADPFAPVGIWAPVEHFARRNIYWGFPGPLECEIDGWILGNQMKSHQRGGKLYYQPLGKFLA